MVPLKRPRGNVWQLQWAGDVRSKRILRQSARGGGEACLLGVLVGVGVAREGKADMGEDEEEGSLIADPCL